MESVVSVIWRLFWVKQRGPVVIPLSQLETNSFENRVYVAVTLFGFPMKAFRNSYLLIKC